MRNCLKTNGQLQETCYSMALKLNYKMYEALSDELSGKYELIGQMVTKLQEDFDQVTINQSYLQDPTVNGLYNAVAAMVYRAQVEHPTKRKKSEIRNAILALATVPMFSSLMVEWMNRMYPCVILFTEHLYFLNRACIMEFEIMPASDRISLKETAKKEDWCFPVDRVDDIRLTAHRIWRSTDVLSSADER